MHPGSPTYKYYVTTKFLFKLLRHRTRKYKNIWKYSQLRSNYRLIRRGLTQRVKRSIWQRPNGVDQKHLYFFTYIQSRSRSTRIKETEFRIGRVLNSDDFNLFHNSSLNFNDTVKWEKSAKEKASLKTEEVQRG